MFQLKKKNPLITTQEEYEKACELLTQVGEISLGDEKYDDYYLIYLKVKDYENTLLEGRSNCVKFNDFRFYIPL